MRAGGLETIMLTNFLPYEFREITGQKLAIWPSIRSRWAFFWAAVSRLLSGTEEPSSVRPLRGLAAVCFCQVTSKKGTKLLSRERIYIKF